MSRYRYKAKNLDSKVVRGRMQAVDESDAYQKISLSGYYPVYLEEETCEGTRKVLKPRYLADFARQTGTMMSSGIPLIQAMNILKQKETNRVMRRYYEDIYQQISGGVVLSDALEAQGNAFPTLMISMFKAGEAGGQLAVSALKMADYYEKDNRLRRKIQAALVYPVFLMVLTSLSLIAIFTVVLPTLFEMFETVEELPLATKILIWISTGLRSHIVEIAVVVFTGVTAIAFLSQRPFVFQAVDRIKLRIPVTGKLMKTIYTSRFARTLSTLYLNGVPLVQCVKISSKVIGNSYIEKQFVQVVEDVCNGVPISAAVSSVDGFDRKLAANIYIGEEAGKLDTMLESMADSFDYEADQAAQKLTTLIEPVMIVVMAVVIGYIMLSVMVPIYQYYENIG